MFSQYGAGGVWSLPPLDSPGESGAVWIFMGIVPRTCLRFL